MDKEFSSETLCLRFNFFHSSNTSKFGITKLAVLELACLKKKVFDGEKEGRNVLVFVRHFRCCMYGKKEVNTLVL